MARFIAFSVPSPQVQSRARILGDFLNGSHILVHVIGSLATEDNVFISRLLCEETPVLRVGALAGPVFAHDLISSSGKDSKGENFYQSFASLVIASRYEEVRKETRRLLGVKGILRVYTSEDLLGVEISSALSGAYSVVCGMADSLGIDQCSRAVLITRIVREASRFIEACGGEASTFSGLAGLGNLLVRSAAQSEEHSFDYCLGRTIGRGDSYGSTEGTRAAIKGAKLATSMGVSVPVLHSLASILEGKVSISEATNLLRDNVAFVE